ncbi:hypothetical protein SLEP1_g57828 [Rubroshorea leprosula]|uniref:Uncharacterized protein n=1 Tax=Rubroshorea leprosula TaxID=152421 RepID=A0AAV5MNK0_9ROSI|nr:hypothetical protein SLEP1_g57828 [Rubroshorea leprosula]
MLSFFSCLRTRFRSLETFSPCWKFQICSALSSPVRELQLVSVISGHFFGRPVSSPADCRRLPHQPSPVSAAGNSGMLTALQAPNLSIYLLPCVSENLLEIGDKFDSN